jgi:hypothetical protein
MAAPEPKKRKTGFLVEEKTAAYGAASRFVSTFREFSKRRNVLWNLYGREQMLRRSESDSAWNDWNEFQWNAWNQYLRWVTPTTSKLKRNACEC